MESLLTTNTEPLESFLSPKVLKSIFPSKTTKKGSFKPVYQVQGTFPVGPVAFEGVTATYFVLTPHHGVYDTLRVVDAFQQTVSDEPLSTNLQRSSSNLVYPIGGSYLQLFGTEVNATASYYVSEM